MTDLLPASGILPAPTGLIAAAPSTAALPPPAAGTPRVARPAPSGLALFAIVGSAAIIGAVVGHISGAGASAAGWDAQLVTLLRFMAAVKFAGVVAGAALVRWRATYPMGPRTSAAYVVALGTMALAPGLIWSLAHVALAAGLFHLGLLSFLAIAWRDSGSLENALRTRPRYFNPVRSTGRPTTKTKGTTAWLYR